MDLGVGDSKAEAHAAQACVGYYRIGFHFELFCIDLVCLSLQEFCDKYDKHIQKDTRIKDVANFLSRRQLEESMVRIDSKGQNADGVCLIKKGSHYEVFVGQSGGQRRRQSFDGLEGACFYWLDLLFQTLGHIAPDSKIAWLEAL